MHKLRTYWQTLTKSASEPSYYRQILGTSLGFSLQFFTFTLFLTSVLMVGNWRLREFPLQYAALREQGILFLNTLPRSFELKLQQGKLQTTGIQIPIEFQATGAMQKAGYGPSLLTITPSDIASRSSITLGPTQMFIAPQPGQTQPTAVTYTEIIEPQDTSLRYQDLENIVNTQLPKLPKLATAFALPGTALTWLFLVLSSLFFLAVLTFLTQVAAWFMGIRLAYKQVFQLGLHAYAVSQLFDELQMILTGNRGFSLLALAYSGIMILVFLDIRKHIRILKVH